MSERDVFPDFIRALPMVDSPLASLRGWMLQTGQALAMFYEIPDGVDVPEHAHGAQWGVVLEGSIDFTIGGETRTYGRGDTYFVPDDVAHSQGWPCVQNQHSRQAGCQLRTTC